MRIKPHGQHAGGDRDQPHQGESRQHVDQMIEIHRGEDTEIERRDPAADQPVPQQVIQRAQQPRPAHDQPQARQDRQRDPSPSGRASPGRSST